MLAEETPKSGSGSLPCTMPVIEHPALYKHLCLYFCEILAAAFEHLMIKEKQVRKVIHEEPDLSHCKNIAPSDLKRSAKPHQQL